MANAQDWISPADENFVRRCRSEYRLWCAEGDTHLSACEALGQWLSKATLCLSLDNPELRDRYFDNAAEICEEERKRGGPWHLMSEQLP